MVGDSKASLFEGPLHGAVERLGSVGVDAVHWQAVLLHAHLAIGSKNNFDHCVERNLGVRKLLHPASKQQGQQAPECGLVRDHHQVVLLLNTFQDRLDPRNDVDVTLTLGISISQLVRISKSKLNREFCSNLLIGQAIVGAGLDLTQLWHDEMGSREVASSLLGPLVLGHPHLRVLQLQSLNKVCESVRIFLSTFRELGVSPDPAVEVVKALAMPASNIKSNNTTLRN